MNTPGQVIKQLKTEFLKRITPLPENSISGEETATFNFIVGCFNDAAADVLIAAYESPATPVVNEDAKRARIEKAKLTREKNKLKKAERRAKRDARKFPKVSADPIVRMQVSEPEFVEA